MLAQRLGRWANINPTLSLVFADIYPHLLFLPEIDGTACSYAIFLMPPVPLSRRLPPNAGLMLGHRLRRWPNIKPASGECLLEIPAAKHQTKPFTKPRYNNTTCVLALQKILILRFLLFYGFPGANLRTFFR